MTNSQIRHVSTSKCSILKASDQNTYAILDYFRPVHGHKMQWMLEINKHIGM